jgi:hypothetical protein
MNVVPFLMCVHRVRDLESVPDMLQQKSVKQVGCSLTTYLFTLC